MAQQDVFYIKQNDRAPSIGALLQYANGAAQDLTGSTVKFNMRLKGATAYKVSASAGIIDNLTGEVAYSWGATDTDAPGTYEGEFEVTLPSARTVTFPNDGYLTIEVTAQVN